MNLLVDLYMHALMLQISVHSCPVNLGRVEDTFLGTFTTLLANSVNVSFMGVVVET